MAELKAKSRRERGTRKARAMRTEGYIPAIIYGHGQTAEAVTLNQHEMELAVHHGERLLEIDVDGKKENVLIKDVQWDTFGQDILHVDLSRVDLDELVTVTVSIDLKGVPAGAADGGVLQQSASEVKIECAVRAIPEMIRVMVNDMKIGDSLYMRDLALPEGAALGEDGGSPVCSVSLVAEEVEEPVEAETSDEPEVIGGKKEQDEEQDAAG